jgi:hypothetical protein
MCTVLRCAYATTHSYTFRHLHFIQGAQLAEMRGANKSNLRRFVEDHASVQ